MPDPTTPPSSAGQPPSPGATQSPTPPNAAPGDYDQAQLETVKKSETLAKAAQGDDYNAALTEEGMLAATPAALLTACAGWRERSKNALDATDEEELETGTGLDAETNLRRTVAYLRGKASMKITQNPTWTEPAKSAFRKRYFIGEDIFASGDTAGQSAKAILDHAAEDALPGVTAAKLTSATAELGAFTGRDDPQSAKQAAATRLRGERDAKFAEVLRLRHEIQHAADTGWPWWQNVNLATRRLFLLPAGRPFTS